MLQLCTFYTYITIQHPPVCLHFDQRQNNYVSSLTNVRAITSAVWPTSEQLVCSLTNVRTTCLQFHQRQNNLSAVWPTSEQLYQQYWRKASPFRVHHFASILSDAICLKRKLYNKHLTKIYMSDQYKSSVKLTFSSGNHSVFCDGGGGQVLPC